MSTEHEVRVVRLGNIHKHDNADSLGITQVDGRPCIVRLAEWSPGDLAVYVPIDALVPVADPRFAFLADKAKLADGRARIKAVRLRGVFSMGLLVKPDADMGEGDEVSERMGIGVWEPDVRFGLSPDAESDPGFLPVYDIESARKWAGVVLEDGEEVVLTEKVHGANGRFAWHRDRMWCASRTRFPRETDSEMWWGVGRPIADRLRDICPGVAIYGEVYGQVQDLRYGRTGAHLVAFDALDITGRRWLDYDELRDLCARLDIPTVPELYRGPWSPDLAAMAEGATVLGNGAHVREGWVLRPVKERHHPALGRVLLKRHGEGYLTRKD